MTLESFVARARALEPVAFDELMAVIERHYRFTPAAFHNNGVDNAAGQNNGSCKLLAFARLHALDPAQTLNLFGDYYHREVLGDPDGSSHANIRAFIRGGWNGVRFEAPVLEPLGRT